MLADAVVLALEVKEIDEVTADVDLVLVMGQELVRRLGVVLDLVAPAVGVGLAQTGQNQE
jgi:hypothetical protein